MHPRGRAGRRRRVIALAATALAGAALAPAAAHAQFPVYSKDKWLGSISEFTRPLFTQYFNQITPENGGKWGVAAGTTRTAAMRWNQLDQAVAAARANGFPFNFHVLLWGNQQPTWMATLPPEEQLAEINKWFAAVAARYKDDIKWLQVVNEPTWDPPDGSVPKNAGSNFASSGNYVQALGGANGTDGTGYDWILNAFRLAKQHFPNTKLMLNDVAITGMTEATDEYLKIINILKRENLIDVIGLQAHAFEFIPNNPNVPSIPGHPYVPVEDMAVHKANLDRIAATGVPIQVTELDLDGFAVNGVPGDEMQLAYYRRVVPTFWEHPSVEGITLWGWRQPNHWRNAQNAPIVLSNDTPKPAALWLYNYVRGIAPGITAEQSFSVGDGNANRVGTVQATDWASQIGRTNLRTFTWQLTGGNDAGIFAIDASTGELRVAKPQLLDELTTYTLQVRVSDGFHTSEPAAVTVVTQDLANVVDQSAGGTVPATLALALGTASFGTFTPGVAKEYDATATATVTSTAGDATLSVADPAPTAPGRLVNAGFSLTQPVQAAAGTGTFAPIGATPQTLHSYGGPSAMTCSPSASNRSSARPRRCAPAATPRRSPSRCPRPRRRPRCAPTTHTGDRLRSIGRHLPELAHCSRPGWNAVPGRRREQPARPLSVRRDHRHGRRRPFRKRQARGHRQWQRRNRVERRAWLDAARRQRRDGARGSAAGRPAVRTRRRHDRLRHPALQRHPAGPGVRVRQDSRQRRVPDGDAWRRHHTAPGVDRGSGRERAGADGRRAGVARRERVDACGGDGQGRRNRHARSAPAVRGRRADDLERHADRQAA